MDPSVYVNFVEEKFSYLNITALGGDFVDNMPECSFACLDISSCFSFNLGTTPEANDRFLCELLPSDKYNNSNKFVHSLIFHHFSIAVSENYEIQVETEFENPEILGVQVSLWRPAAKLICSKL